MNHPGFRGAADDIALNHLENICRSAVSSISSPKQLPCLSKLKTYLDVRKQTLWVRLSKDRNCEIKHQLTPAPTPFLRGFPVIHCGWNPKPQVPTKWVISIALMQLFFWSLLTFADELMAADPLGFVTKSELTTLQWVDACLGLICVATLILVGHLLKTHSDFSWRALLTSSLVTTVIFIYVLHCAMNGGSISRKMLHSYKEVLLNTGSHNDKIGVTSFPPFKIVFLLMTKV